MPNNDGWDARAGRQEVIHEGGGYQLSMFVVESFLEERVTDAMDDTSVDLALDDHWVDHGAAFMNRDVPEKLHNARVDIDFDGHHVCGRSNRRPGWNEEVLCL